MSLAPRSNLLYVVLLSICLGAGPAIGQPNSESSPNALGPDSAASLPGPGQAAEVRNGVPEIVRCEAGLIAPTDETIQLQAWGPNAVAAVEQLVRILRVTAEIHAHPVAWAALREPDSAAGVTFAEQLLVVGSDSDEQEGDPSRLASEDLFLVPGYRYSGVACEAFEVPGTTEPSNWRVTWAGSEGSVMRASAAAAIEASRRRSCLLGYQAALDSAIMESIHLAEPEERARILSDASSVATSAAVSCFSAASGPAIEVVSAEAFRDGEGTDLYACVAEELSQGGGVARARAWGDSPSWAMESSLTALIYAVYADSFANGTQIVLSGHPEQQDRELLAEFRRLSRVVPQIEGLEALQLRCSREAPIEGQAPDLRWTPEEPARRICGSAETWRLAVEMPTAAEEPPFALLQRLQRRLLTPGLVRLREAWEETGRDTSLALGGRGIVAQCEASSLSDLSYGGFASESLAPSIVQHSSRATAEQAVATALQEMDIVLLASSFAGSTRSGFLAALAEMPVGADAQSAFWIGVAGSIQSSLDAGALIWAETPEGWLLQEAARPSEP